MKSRKNDAVLIIGCGWLGKQLGQQLQSEFKTVYGTTRSSSNFSELSDLGINPIKLELPAPSLSDIRLPEVDAAVISIAPGRGDDRSDYPLCIKQISQVLAERNVQTLMYSSTSVYGNAKNDVTETDAVPDVKSNNTILAAEGELIKHVPDAVILRLSGLYGADRHPVKFMAGRKNISDGDAPVNLIHSSDVIQVTELIIKKKITGEIFNVTTESHPSRNEIYTKIAERMELKVPTFEDGGSDGKVVSSEKLHKALKLKFKHPDPEAFLLD